MRRTKVTIVAVAALLVAAAALFARGPVGPTSVVHKNVQMLVERAASRAGAAVTGERMVEPSTVPLQLGLAIKRSLKVAFASVGLAHIEKEVAQQYEVVDRATSQTVRCTVRIRGDHVLALVIDVSNQEGDLLKRLLPEISANFSKYIVAVRSAA